MIKFNQMASDRGVRDELNRRAVNGMIRVGLAAERYAKLLCPVDTGRLRNSITNIVDDDETVIRVYVGTNVEYGKYVEHGTTKMDAQPLLKPALADHASDFMRIIQDSMM